MKVNRNAGFTLLEVLVALMILAIAMGAVINAVGASASQVGYLRDQTLASWVALNEINRMLLDPDWPDADTSTGSAEMAGQAWRWQMEISETSDPDLRRLDVSVHLEGEDETPLASLIAFKGRHAEGSALP